MSNSVIVFGEMLWDCLPTGKVPGGAPMNVALNLHQLGIPTALISAVGRDTDGEQLIEFLNSFGVLTHFIQQIPAHQTSQVLVDDTDPENMKYTIVSPVAWDFIAWNEAMDQTVKNSDALVFGTLAVRNKKSLDTLLKLLQHPTLRIFDVNFRAPYFEFPVVETLLQHTDILKLNEDELEAFASYFHVENSIEAVCTYLQQHFSIEVVCVTLGAAGAVLYKNGESYRHSGYPVNVVDTIGAGDAFLSGFIKAYLAHAKPNEIIDFACKLGAFIASKKGGAVPFTLDEVNG